MKTEITDRIVNVIEDHANITQFIDQLYCAIECELEFPNFIPVLHDTLVTDQLSKICEYIKKLKKDDKRPKIRMMGEE